MKKAQKHAAAQVQRLRARRTALQGRAGEVVVELDAAAIDLLAVDDDAASGLHTKRLALISEILALPAQVARLGAQISIALLNEGKAKQAVIDEEVVAIQARRDELAAQSGGDELEIEMRAAGVAALDRKIAERRAARVTAMGGYSLSGLTERDTPDPNDPESWPLALRNEAAERRQRETKRIRALLFGK